MSVSSFDLHLSNDHLDDYLPPDRHLLRRVSRSSRRDGQKPHIVDATWQKHFQQRASPTPGSKHCFLLLAEMAPSLRMGAVKTHRKYNLQFGV